MSELAGANGNCASIAGASSLPPPTTGQHSKENNITGPNIAPFTHHALCHTPQCSCVTMNEQSAPNPGPNAAPRNCKYTNQSLSALHVPWIVVVSQPTCSHCNNLLLFFLLLL